METLRLDDQLDYQRDLVAIEVCITSARRSCQIADAYRRRGIFVALGGLHVTSLPAEAAPHADAMFTGAGGRHVAAVPGGFTAREREVTADLLVKNEPRLASALQSSFPSLFME
ncbi:MAG TPA: hypothetical protein VNY05_04215 [Candidatus Acidoferrales bacterium]|nr:hypothetical protein [Candidatus Acidoferrales bacterium]